MFKEMNTKRKRQHGKFFVLKIVLTVIVFLCLVFFGVLTYKTYAYEKDIALRAINEYELASGEEITEITIDHSCNILQGDCDTDVYFNDLEREHVSYGAWYCYESLYNSVEEEPEPSRRIGGYNFYEGATISVRSVPGTRTNLDGIKVHYDFVR